MEVLALLVILDQYVTKVPDCSCDLPGTMRAAGSNNDVLDMHASAFVSPLFTAFFKRMLKHIVGPFMCLEGGQIRRAKHIPACAGPCHKPWRGI